MVVFPHKLPKPEFHYARIPLRERRGGFRAQQADDGVVEKLNLYNLTNQEDQFDNPSLSILIMGMPKAGGVVAFLFIFLLLCFQSFSQTALIPQAQKTIVLGDSVRVPNTVTVAAPLSFQAAQALLTSLAETEWRLSVTPENDASAGFFIVFTKNESSITTSEGYKIMIMPTGIWVEAATPQGALRAVQTIRQLLFLATKIDDQYLLFAQTIVDQPTFPHRGLLLDCSRHFFSVETVEKYIDLLA